MRSLRRITVLIAVFLLAAIFLPWTSANAQDTPALTAPFRWTFDTKIGSEPQLGFNAPGTSFGPSIEYPLANQFELQGNLTFTPWESINSGNGHAIEIGGTGIGWFNHRFGASLGFRRDWLWASSISRSAWNPSIGGVIRDELYRPGRLYIAYLLPTGCSQMGPSCSVLSNRTQGLQALQEIRLWSRFRVGLQGGVYHYCDNATQSDARQCKFSPAGMVVIRFELANGDAGSSY
jgi:hypothetical protein